MAIDACQHTFIDLTLHVLPSYMDTLRRSIERPMQMAQFSQPGIGPKKLGLREISGCYVLLDGPTPIYVGISRTVFRRLRQHALGETHYDASLAYLMARKKVPHTTTRSEAMKHAEFRPAFDAARNHLQSLACAFVEIENPLELHLFEPFCAMELDTGEWNSFRTH